MLVATAGRGKKRTMFGEGGGDGTGSTEARAGAKLRLARANEQRADEKRATRVSGEPERYKPWSTAQLTVLTVDNKQ